MSDWINKLINTYGSNLFNTNTQDTYVFQSKKAYSKGESLFYQGRKFICQNDIAENSTVLLVLQGGIALGESLQPVSTLSETTVLNRRVNDLPRAVNRIYPWLWSLTFYDLLIQYPNKRVRIKENQLDFTIENLVADIDDSSYFIWVDKRDNFYAIRISYENYDNDFEWDVVSTFSNKPAEIIKIPRFEKSINHITKVNNYLRNSASSFLDRVEKVVDFSTRLFSILLYAETSYFDSGFVTTIDNPSIFSKGVEYTFFEVKRDFYAQASKSSDSQRQPTSSRYEFKTYLTPDTYFEGFHDCIHFWHFRKFLSYDGPKNIIDRDLRQSTVNKTSYVHPLLHDPSRNLSVVYEIKDYNFEVFYQRFYIIRSEEDDGSCTKYNVSGSAKCYLLDGKNNQKTEVNSTHPYFIPLTLPGTEGLKTSYQPGDRITAKFDSSYYTIGFLSDSGHYRRDPNLFANFNHLIKCEPTDTSIPRFEGVTFRIDYQYNYVTDLTAWDFTFGTGQVVQLNNFPATGTRSREFGGPNFAVPLGAEITFVETSNTVELSRPGEPESGDSDGLTATFFGFGSSHDVFSATFDVYINGEKSITISASDGGSVRRYLLNSAGSRQYAYDVGFTATGFTPSIVSRELIPLDPVGEQDPSDPGNGGFSSSIPDNKAREGEVAKFKKIMSAGTPCWGYLPTTEARVEDGYYRYVYGVKGRLIETIYESTNKGHAVRGFNSLITHMQPIPLAEIQFIKEVTFEIEEICTDKISFEQTSSIWKTYQDYFPYILENPSDEFETFREEGGVLIIGNSFGICRESMLEGPEYGVTSGAIVPDEIMDFPKSYGHYIWKGNYLYKYPKNLYWIKETPPFNKGYAEQFEFVLDQENNIYNLEFVNWVEMDFSSKPLESKDLFFKPENKAD